MKLKGKIKDKKALKGLMTIVLMLTVLLAANGCRTIQQLPQHKYYRQGSASTLEGRIYVHTIFITENSWRPEEIDSTKGMIVEAEEWLTAQASRYGKKVSFVNGYSGDDKGIFFNEIEAGHGTGNESSDVLMRTLPRIGYITPKKFAEWVDKNIDCDNYLVVVVANKEGRGYAINYDSLLYEDLYYVECVMQYNKYESGKPKNAASYAHEICHLFGALDLYATFAQTEENEKRARKLFPDDIMLRTSYNINSLVIDRLTAWSIGLTKKKKAWYDSFLY